MNKKGNTLGDMFDLLFTLFIGFFILTFTIMIINGSLAEKQKTTEKQTERVQKVQSYLSEQRFVLESGAEINEKQINRDIDFIKKRGFIPGKIDRPNVPVGYKG